MSESYHDFKLRLIEERFQREEEQARQELEDSERSSSEMRQRLDEQIAKSMRRLDDAWRRTSDE
jgi:hypothetical protein